jgi:6,7-dimethyl-8-ribityllumazine synthase
LEFVDGKFPSTADVLVEVTALDAVHQAAAAWLRTQGGETAVARLAPISETHWKSRIFTVEPEPGFAFSFWAWTDPLRAKPVAVEGDLSASGMRFAVVVARWNAVITERLLEAALDALLRSGAKRADVEVVRVPGAWEIPAAARTIANVGKVDAIITLGCLLRGETAHYEAIYNEVARGIGQSQQETGIPHSFGVLTCETLEQALNRAGIKAGNKGFEAATAAIEMVSLRRKLLQGDVLQGGPS